MNEVDFAVAKALGFVIGAVVMGWAVNRFPIFQRDLLARWRKKPASQDAATSPEGRGE